MARETASFKSGFESTSSDVRRRILASSGPRRLNGSGLLPTRFERTCGKYFQRADAGFLSPRAAVPARSRPMLLTCQAGFEVLLVRELTELHGMSVAEQGPG